MHWLIVHGNKYQAEIRNENIINQPLKIKLLEETQKLGRLCEIWDVLKKNLITI
jgi:hypothetical protein